MNVKKLPEARERPSERIEGTAPRTGAGMVSFSNSWRRIRKYPASVMEKKKNMPVSNVPLIPPNKATKQDLKELYCSHVTHLYPRTNLNTFKNTVLSNIKKETFIMSHLIKNYKLWKEARQYKS